MEASSEDNPKLFKLTAAVTAIQPIIKRIQEVFAKYPNKKAGVTLANSFPSLVLRKAENRRWEEGVVVGMSGEGVLPISNLTLAKVSGMGIAVSGNGGPMNYKAAANFLALGAQTVQFCTIVMKYGLGIVDELHSGLSFLMEERGFKSVQRTDWLGAAQSDHRFHGPVGHQEAAAGGCGTVRALRQLHALPVPGHHLERKEGPGLRSRALHRLFALRAEMFRRRHLHAPANRP